MNNVVKLVIAIFIPLAIGLTSGFFTISGVNSWYQTILKPTWNPPNWIFGPVWTTLYILMGIALFLVWKSSVNKEFKQVAFLLFGIQLVLNFFWSFIFFNQQQIWLALIEIIIMLVAIFFTIITFANINKVAAWLLVPYISWVSFATILNYAIWKLNS